MSATRGELASTAGPGGQLPSHRKRFRGPQVPIAPLMGWCHEQVRLAERRCGHPKDPLFAPHRELAARLGVNVRILNRIMRGMYAGGKYGRKGEFPTDVIGRFYVEDMLTHAGVDFYELYPSFEFERDIVLEPDGWCRCCREFVTPILGLCPWDDTPVDIAKQWAA